MIVYLPTYKVFVILVGKFPGPRLDRTTNGLGRGEDRRPSRTSESKVRFPRSVPQ